jgi:transcriptional regulator with XRE-family HTH domain
MTGDKIKSYRQSLGLSQADFAEKIGIRQGHLSEIERGSKNAGAKVLKSLFRLFPDLSGDIFDENPKKMHENSRSTPVKTTDEPRDHYLVDDGSRIGIRAIGGRMTVDGIREWDLLTIDREETPENGDYVLVKVDDAPGIVRWTEGDPKPIGVLISLKRAYK